MTDRTDAPEPSRTPSEERKPDAPPPDSYRWTNEPGAPDVAGMPGEFVNDPGEDVPGVRRGGGTPPAPDEPDQFD